MRGARHEVERRRLSQREEPDFDEEFRVMQPPLYEPAQPDGPESA